MIQVYFLIIVLMSFSMYVIDRVSRVQLNLSDCTVFEKNLIFELKLVGNFELKVRVKSERKIRLKSNREIDSKETGRFQGNCLIFKSMIMNNQSFNYSMIRSYCESVDISLSHHCHSPSTVPACTMYKIRSTTS